MRSVWTPGGASSKGGTTYMSKSYFGHISETIKARDLIFGTGANQGLENTVPWYGHQVELPLQVAAPTYQDIILTTSPISRKLLNLET